MDQSQTPVNPQPVNQPAQTTGSSPLLKICLDIIFAFSIFTILVNVLGDLLFFTLLIDAGFNFDKLPNEMEILAIPAFLSFITLAIGGFFIIIFRNRINGKRKVLITLILTLITILFIFLPLYIQEFI